MQPLHFPPAARTLTNAPGTTLAQYVAELRGTGRRVAPGCEGTAWVATGHVLRRVPAFHCSQPDHAEVDQALRETGALVASYVTEPDERHAPNAWLYLCADRDYSARALPPAVRRNIRRAFRELTIAPVSRAEMRLHGGPAFCDTLRRTRSVGHCVSDFQRTFAQHNPEDRPGRSFLGAWKDGELAAYLTILHVDDWVELGCVSQTSMLRYRPNDALLYVALSHYLGFRRCQVVSFGVSSIQRDSNRIGLHRFKRKLGFEARPVHRAFTFHPALRPFANRLTLSAVDWMATAAGWVRPEDRRLKKLGGMVASVLETMSTLSTTTPTAVASATPLRPPGGAQAWRLDPSETAR